MDKELYDYLEDNFDRISKQLDIILKNCNDILSSLERQDRMLVEMIEREEE